MEKVIFLDIDGVLTSNEWAENVLKQEGYRVDEFNELCLGKIALLKEIVDATGAKIVLSSSWRFDEAALTAVKNQLAQCDLDVFDLTSQRIDVVFNRTKELKLYIEEHHPDAYLILDDEIIKDAELAPHQVRTSLTRGLLKKDVEPAIKILEGEEN